MKRVALVVLVIALLGLAAGGWFAYLAVRAKTVYHTTFVYTLRAEYATLPADDKALEEWLREQPEVEKATVTRDGKAIVVEYQTTGDSLLTRIIDKCKILGYEGGGAMTFNGQGFVVEGERKAPSR